MLTVCERALEAWLEVCSDLGIPNDEPQRLARSSQSHVVPLADFVRMPETTAPHYKLGPLGWVAGERYEFRRLGEVGNAILSSSTLGSTLQRFTDYFALVRDAAEFEVRTASSTVTIRCRILASEIWPRQNDALFTLSIIAQLLRRARGFDWRSVNIALEGDDPALTAAPRHRTGAEDNGNIFQRIHGYRLENGEISFGPQDSRWNVAVWGKNIFNKYYVVYDDLPGNSNYVRTVGAPATCGVRLGMSL